MDVSSRRQFVLLGLFTLSAVLGALDRQSIALLKPILSGEFGWTDSDYATIIACYQGTVALALLFTGSVVDRVSVRWLGPMIFAGYSIAMFAQIFVRSVGEVAATRMWLALFVALAGPASLRIISDILPPVRRALGFGFSSAGVTVGSVIAPLTVPLMAVLWGWRTSQFVLGVLGLAWVAVWLLVYRPQGMPAAPVDRPRGWRWERRIVGNRRYQKIAIAKALSDLTWWLMVFWAPDFFQRQFDLSVVAAGPYIAAIYLSAACGALLFGAESTRRIAAGQHPAAVRIGVMLAGLICIAILPLAACVADAWLAAMVIALALFGHQAFGVSGFVIIGDEAAPGEQGRFLAYSQFCGNIGGLIVVKATGLLLDSGAGYLPILALMPFAYLASLAIYRHILNPRTAVRTVAANP